MIRSEYLKLKRTALPYLCIVAAIIVPVVLFFDLSTEPSQIQQIKKDPWNIIIIECWKGMNFLILPLYIILISTLVPYAEHRNHTWKQVFTSPLPPLKVFLSKFLLIQIMIILMLLIFTAASLIMVIALHSVYPALQVFEHSPDWMKVLTLIGQTCIAVLGISAIQYFLGMQFKNFIVPMGTGFFLWLLLPIALELEWAHLNKFPYSYSVYLLFPKYASIVPYILLGSVGYAVLFLTISYKRFRTVI